MNPLLIPEPATSLNAEREMLKNWLLRYGQWITASGLVQYLTEAGWTDRKIQQVASESDRIISGQKGYRHSDCATVAEINHAANWLESQAAKMTARAIGLRKAAHQRIS